MLHYKVVEECTLNRLELAVRKLITKGYIPLGGVSLEYRGHLNNTRQYIQALTKKD